jgi:hypothetical protein
MPTQTTAIVALDGFDDYYAEKLWNWIPGFYREQDAYTPTPGTLREIIESMGEQSAELRRGLDRIWENFFVELADDDALEALGELVATRMVHALNRRARRVDVARTIYYRRRKGTPRVLESLLTDITGWAGAHLESRKRLARSYHLLEPAPDPSLALFTKTPRGGWANLRSPRIPALAWTAFEELAHTPDVRRHAGKAGRFGIPKVNLHLHRTRAFKVTYPTVVVIGTAPVNQGDTGKYALDPSGRSIALFQPTDRPSADSWARMREWQVPRAIERRLLDHNEYEWGDDELATLAAAPYSLGATEIAYLKKYADLRVPNFRTLARLIDSFPDPPKTDLRGHILEIMQTTMVSDCGRRRLYGDNQALALAIGPDNNTATSLTREQIQVGNLEDWGANWDLTKVFDANLPGHYLVVDPQLGTVMSQSTGSDNMIAPVLYYGFPGEVGAGTYSRLDSLVTAGATLDDGGDGVGRVPVTLNLLASVEQLENSKTYTTNTNLVDVEDYRLQAKNLERPYLLCSKAESPTTWTITAKTKGANEVRNLAFEGVWIGIEDSAAGVENVGAGNPATPVEGRLVLAESWDRVEITHCTLDPGGEQVRDAPGDAVAIQYVTLEISGFIEELIIDHSIVGPILGTNSSLDGCAVGKLIIRDSIVMSIDSNVPQAIDVELGEVYLERSTVVGGITANRIYASDSLVTGAGVIADRQNGCFRFSAGVEGGWPRAYESYFFSQFDPAWVHSQRFGDADFLRLTDLAPEEIRMGAENHCEMGVWNHLLDEIKRTDLQAKLGEFMPFDLLMQLVTEN